MANKKTSIVPAKLKTDVARFQTMITTLGVSDGGLSLLPSIKLKHAGTVAYGIATAEGEVIVNDFEANVLHIHPARVHWHGKFGEGEERMPECSSIDAIKGSADDGTTRACASCEFAKWGSADSGRGQACRKQMRLFLYLFDKKAPHVLIIPVSSIKVPEKYWMNLFNVDLDIKEVVTTFGAEEVSNAENIKYSRVVMTKSRELGADIVDTLQPMRDACAALAQQMPVTEDAINGMSDKGTDEEVFAE